MNRYLPVFFAISVSVVLPGCAGARFERQAATPRVQDDSSTDPDPQVRQPQGEQHSERTPTGSEPFHGMIQYRAKDAKQAILNPEFVQADETVIAPGTKVIGVFIAGEARAYPLFILNNHQVVNDQVGGIPLSASW